MRSYLLSFCAALILTTPVSFAGSFSPSITAGVGTSQDIDSNFHFGFHMKIYPYFDHETSGNFSSNGIRLQSEGSILDLSFSQVSGESFRFQDLTKGYSNEIYQYLDFSPWKSVFIIKIKPIAYSVMKTQFISENESLNRSFNKMEVGPQIGLNYIDLNTNTGMDSLIYIFFIEGYLQPSLQSLANESSSSLGFSINPSIGIKNIFIFDDVGTLEVNGKYTANIALLGQTGVGQTIKGSLLWSFDELGLPLFIQGDYQHQNFGFNFAKKENSEGLNSTNNLFNVSLGFSF
jgi:hypothetical protein